MATKRRMWWHTIVAVILVCVSKPAVGAPPGKPADTAAVEDSKKLVTNSIGMKLTLIPAGEFLMGSPESEEGHYRDSTRHRVRITHPFYLGVYEVTQGEYEQVMGKGTNPSHNSPKGWGKNRVKELDTSRLPVEQVTWEEAVEFCRALSARPEEERAGRRYRLPTEAEWEYACRAGTETPFHFGKELNGREANCHGGLPYGTSVKGPWLQRTTISGSYKPNAFGLYDMHGNVGEWCQDWYDGEYYGNSPVDDPPGPQMGKHRVIRGGGSDMNALACRSACRNADLPSGRSQSTGFRIAFKPTGE